MKGCADKSILGLALAAQYLSHGTYLTACWQKKASSFRHKSRNWGPCDSIQRCQNSMFFGSCYRNILTLKCMVFALELRVLNVRLGPYSAICTVRKHSFGGS